MRAQKQVRLATRQFDQWEKGRLFSSLPSWEGATRRRDTLTLALSHQGRGKIVCSCTLFQKCRVLKASEGRVSGRHSARISHGLGIRNVLLIMAQPLAKYRRERGCQWNEAMETTPRGRRSPTYPVAKQIISTRISSRLEGIGVPSKYFTFPVASAS